MCSVLASSGSFCETSSVSSENFCSIRTKRPSWRSKVLFCGAFMSRRSNPTIMTKSVSSFAVCASMYRSYGVWELGVGNRELPLLEFHERHARLHRLAGVARDRADTTVMWSGYCLLHLHGFEEDEDVAGFDSLAGRDVD